MRLLQTYIIANRILESFLIFSGYNYRDSPIQPSQGELWVKAQSLQLIALNDCLFRNMYMYEHIAIMDTDELVVPQFIRPNGIPYLIRCANFNFINNFTVHNCKIPVQFI